MGVALDAQSNVTVDHTLLLGPPPPDPNADPYPTSQGASVGVLAHGGNVTLTHNVLAGNDYGTYFVGSPMMLSVTGNTMNSGFCAVTAEGMPDDRVTIAGNTLSEGPYGRHRGGTAIYAGGVHADINANYLSGASAVELANLGHGTVTNNVIAGTSSDATSMDPYLAPRRASRTSQSQISRAAVRRWRES